MESAEHRCHPDRFGRVDLESAVGGHHLFDSLMWPRIVEVDHVLSSQRVEVPIIEQQNVIEHLASDAADEALSRGVHVGCPDGNLDDPDSGSLGDAVEGGSELVVAISHKHLRGCAVHSCVGFLVTATWTTRLDARWTMKKA